MVDSSVVLIEKTPTDLFHEERESRRQEIKRGIESSLKGLNITRDSLGLSGNGSNMQWETIKDIATDILVVDVTMVDGTKRVKTEELIDRDKRYKHMDPLMLRYVSWLGKKELGLTAEKIEGILLSLRRISPKVFEKEDLGITVDQIKSFLAERNAALPKVLPPTQEAA